MNSRFIRLIKHGASGVPDRNRALRCRPHGHGGGRRAVGPLGNFTPGLEHRQSLMWMCSSRRRFAKAPQEMTVPGFYDGEGTYRLRFSPPKQGKWTYETKSNLTELSGQDRFAQCREADRQQSRAGGGVQDVHLPLRRRHAVSHARHHELPVDEHAGRTAADHVKVDRGHRVQQIPVLRFSQVVRAQPGRAGSRCLPEERGRGIRLQPAGSGLLGALSNSALSICRSWASRRN